MPVEWILKMKKLIVLMLVLVVAGSLATARSVEFSLVQSMAYFPYTENSVLEKGDYSVTLEAYYSNTFMFNHEMVTMNDYETLSLTAAVRYGVLEGGVLEVYIRTTSMFGGSLDKLIENFHDAFNLPDDRRPEFPRNIVNYSYEGSFGYIENQSVFAPLVVGFLKQLYRTERFSLNARASIGIPLSDKPGFSSKKLFFTAGAIASMKAPKSKFSAEFSAHLAFFSQPQWLIVPEEDIRSTMFFGQMELRWRFMIGGLSLRTSPFKYGDLAHTAYQGFIGFRITRHIDFLLIEDFKPFDTTPDVSFHLRIRLK